MLPAFMGMIFILVGAPVLIYSYQGYKAEKQQARNESE